jgi:hypothetical protein
VRKTNKISSKKAILFTVLLFVVLSGCVQQNTKPEVAKIPSLNFEATVISLSLSEVTEDAEDIMFPEDAGIIRIDRINSLSSNFDWISAGVEEGKEITIQFQYSARPAKLRKISSSKKPTSTLPETPISSSIITFGIEDGYFIYGLKSTSITKETETVLPGLRVGSKFRATGWYGYGGIQGITVGEYEIIF